MKGMLLATALLLPVSAQAACGDPKPPPLDDNAKQAFDLIGKKLGVLAATASGTGDPQEDFSRTQAQMDALLRLIITTAVTMRDIGYLEGIKSCIEHPGK